MTATITLSKNLDVLEAVVDDIEHGHSNAGSALEKSALDFEAQVRAIHKRDGCDRLQAMQRARKEFPHLLEAFELASADRTESVEVGKGKGARDAGEKFEQICRDIGRKENCDKRTAMTRARQRNPEAYAALVANFEWRKGVCGGWPARSEVVAARSNLHLPHPATASLRSPASMRLALVLALSRSRTTRTDVFSERSTPTGIALGGPAGGDRDNTRRFTWTS